MSSSSPQDTTTNNIAEPIPSEVAKVTEAVEKAAATAATQQPSPNPPPTTQNVVPKPISDFYNVAQACELISRHYDRGFKNLKFRLPMQVVDNCVADFVDADMDVVVATARVRYRNRIHIDPNNGEMRAEVHLSDLTYARSELNLAVNNKNRK